MTENKKYVAVDGNEAVANVSYQTSEVIALYPITPSSTMGEWCDTWAAHGRTNLWNSVPKIIEMQSEGGAAGAVHGSLQAGALTTTFTASQGLLLMIPNMYKIAGELTSAVIHVSARTLATHALSIFGDHSDVMSTRSTGWALLASGSVQEAQDMAIIAMAATLQARVPFLHFFDGFRTSHEVAKIIQLQPEELRKMLDVQAIEAHRSRSLSPDRPMIRGTAQNPDVFFQARESANPYYQDCSNIVQENMNKFKNLTGRSYKLFDYYGDPDATSIIVVMGSGVETIRETVQHLNQPLSQHGKKFEKVGVVQVRLYRPFDTRAFCEALPASVKRIAVLDRTKEPGAIGEPLYIDCIAALQKGLRRGYCKFTGMPEVIGGRYGLSSKEFTPAMVKAIYENLVATTPKESFTVGINDDVTHLSLKYDESFSLEKDNTTRAIFYGLGADGTVGANKNSIKIIAENTDFHAQGYFVYDSKKSGAITISHLRFGPDVIRAPYLITRANFVACHQTIFLDRYDTLRFLEAGGTFLLNAPFGADKAFSRLPLEMQEQLCEKRAKFYIIDAYKVAKDAGMGRHINTIMQTCFFAISGVMPRDKAMRLIEGAIRKTYANKGQAVIEKNIQAVAQTLDHLYEVKVPEQPIANSRRRSAPAYQDAIGFTHDVLGKILSGDGDQLPVSSFLADGTFPTGTSKWEKRGIALEIPEWDENVCTQCGKCAMVCPHSAIRIKVYEPKALEKAPDKFKHTGAREKDWQGLDFSVQVSPEDCTGCNICVDVCPASSKLDRSHKALMMRDIETLRKQENTNWNFFLKIPDLDRKRINITNVRQQQAQQPLFEFSGACSGCGETPYVKLLTQLYGDRLMIANATGCSSIFGGNLPTTPWTCRADGLGPSWSNSLFEDNAEFGLGFRLAVDKQSELARELLKESSGLLGDQLVGDILAADQTNEEGINAQRERVKILKEKLLGRSNPQTALLLSVADYLVRKTIWILGGDGWAYDIGFGGLDHVISGHHDVNILVMDTEVYSNTGGQMSKATPLGAMAKFAESGKVAGKKDLGLIAMSYGTTYVASVAMGAKDRQTLKAIVDAESYPGPSLVIAYSHCISHGIDTSVGMSQQEIAVKSGHWLLYRFDPRLAAEGKNPLQLDSAEPTVPLVDYYKSENRFQAIAKTKPEAAARYFDLAQARAKERWRFYNHMATYFQNK